MDAEEALIAVGVRPELDRALQEKNEAQRYLFDVHAPTSPAPYQRSRG